MTIDRLPIFDAVAAMIPGGFAHKQDLVDKLDMAIDKATGERTERLYSKPLPAPAPSAPKFRLSERSLNELKPVFPELVHCVKLAILYTPVDFRVNEGLRSRAQQKQNVAKGVSRTMNSKHLVQKDGYCHAVDLVALKDGKVTWDFDTYAGIAYAMDRAATELGIADHIRWGCAWDRVLSDFGGNPKAYLAEAEAYVWRHPGSDLLDAPHFEWVP